MSNDIPLPQLSARLLAATGRAGPGYAKLHKLAVSGAFPVHWRNGRLYVPASALPAVAEAVGLSNNSSEGVAA